MDGGPEPAHMLNSTTLIAAAKCLQDTTSGGGSDGGGRIVIVTDNMNYARLLCSTVVKIIRQNKSILRSCHLDLSPSSHLREIESFPVTGTKGGKDRVALLEGQPSPVIGHGVSGKGKGSSYFDRLWRTGASGHASKRERYIILLERCNAHDTSKK